MPQAGRTLCYGPTWGWHGETPGWKQAVTCNICLLCLFCWGGGEATGCGSELSNSCFIVGFEGEPKREQEDRCPFEIREFSGPWFLSGLFYRGDMYPALLSCTRVAWALLFAMAEPTGWFQAYKNLGYLCSCRLMEAASQEMGMSAVNLLSRDDAPRDVKLTAPVMGTRC